MNRPGLRWCLGYSLVLAILTTLPYLHAAAAEGQDWRFTGFIFGVEDGHSYLAKMRRGAEGEWLFRSPYSTQPQRGVIAFVPYLLLGKLAGGSPEYSSMVLLYHGFRVIATPFAVLATHRFLGIFVGTESIRRWGTVLATLGGGLGWVTLLFTSQGWLGSLALEFYSPETFGFLGFFGIPHLLLARAALLYALVWFLESEREPRRSWWSGAALLALALAQPIGLLIAAAVITAHGIVSLGTSTASNWRREGSSWLARAVRSFAIPAPFMLYLIYAYLTDDYLQAWAAQNLVISPHPLHYILAYGLLSAPAGWGMWLLIRSQDRAPALAVAWVVAAPALAYAPLVVQRRLTDGVWVALLALAGFGLQRTRAALRKPALALIFALSLPSSLVLLAGGFGIGLQPGTPAYLRSGQAVVFDEIADATRLGDVVFSSFVTGNALPAWAPVQVPMGHGPESAGLADLQPRIESFFSLERGDEYRLSLLSEVGADYIFFGPDEAALGSWDPAVADFLALKLKREGYAVYTYRGED